MQLVVFLLLSSMLQALAQCPGDSCVFPPSCNTHITVDSASGADVNLSPFYEQILSAGGDNGDLDSSCCTFFPLGNGTYTFIRSMVTTNGSTYVQRYVYASVLSTPGVFRAQGILSPDACDTCVFNDYVLGQPCPGLFVFYRCYIFGGCQQDYSGQDNIFVFSSSRTISQECVVSALSLAHSQAQGNPDPVLVPNSMPARCVTRLGQTDAINANRVPCDQRLALS